MSSTGDNNSDFIWDDTLLVKSYDSSINMARGDLAKIIASRTNQIKSDDETQIKKCERTESSSEETASMPTNLEDVVFKIGDYVRATYDDGIDYEAKILNIDENDETCLIKYIGYNNEQTVQIKDLLPTWGKTERRKQYQTANKNLNTENEYFATDVLFESNDNYHIPMPNNYNNGTIPPPPPVPPMLMDLSNYEDAEQLSAMLMSWYMSGYYTGVFQGERIARQKLVSANLKK